MRDAANSGAVRLDCGSGSSCIWSQRMSEAPGGPMRYGTIGAGAIGQAIANHLVNAGHEVVLSNRRGPSSLEPVVSRLGPLASAGTVQEAASADMVFLAVMW